MFERYPKADSYVGLELVMAEFVAGKDLAVADLRIWDLDEPGSFLMALDLQRDRLNLVVRRGMVIEAAWC